jgi:O-antigen ligase
MNPMRNAWATTFAGSPWFGLKLLVAATLIMVSLLLLPKLYVAAALGALIVSAALIFLVATTMHARVNGVLLAWLLISPLGYYFLSFPLEKPIFTFDRLVIVILTGAIIFVDPSHAFPVPTGMKRAGLAWAVFIAFAFTSLIGVWRDLGLAGSRLIVEAFIFPALMAVFIIRVFPAERYVRPMHTLIGLTTVYCAAIGIVELLTDTDLLPLPINTFYPAEQTETIARVNGPFATNHCLGLIGMVLLFLLFFLRTVMDGPVHRGRRWFHGAAISAALIVVLLPQFRTLIIGLAIALFLELYNGKRGSGRLASICIILVLALGVMLLPSIAPAYFQTRVADPANLYGRIAQQEQTWQLFLDHPLNGAGFANFMQAIQTVSTTEFKDIESLNAAHNSLGSILAETGIAGCLPFIVANVFWFLMFFRLRNSGLPIAAAAYRFFLYIFICYWLVALTLTSAYERDLNLWYMFACAIMYKLALVEKKNSQRHERTQAKAHEP